ncbi:ISL3 family transposase [Paenibacillus sp. YN15]|uniref:ISL3 family transposase n=1 Tax=Paenibacillus sp. YN15 TaxID=1742774 RepID=UPI000DCD6C6E|nr:ISL3 family transposase [Paenibacillus sp. YN15]RAU90750.1 ISL3 family transposase [Paenibacillus sp. YN15]
MFAVTFSDGQMEELLHIPEPWYIDQIRFELELKQLDVYVKFRKDAMFTCSDCGAPYQPVKDIADRDRTWRHLNFFEYPCYIHAELPRTHCGKCNRIMRVNVPWALDKPKHYFTLYFDALIIKLAKDMPMNAVSRLLGEHDTRLWRILHHYVDNAIAAQDLSHVTKISTDETSAKRGHNYITIFMDPEQKNVIYVTKGRDSGTWAECKNQLEAHGGKADHITEVCMDMSPAFIKGAEANFPKAAITFDKFHVIQAANEAVDEVRRRERKSSAILKDTRYLWLKNPDNLTDSQKETMAKLKDCDLDTAKAYRMRLILQEIYRYPASIAPAVLQDWIQWGLRCRLAPMVEVAKMLQKHYDGVIQWFKSKLNNGLLEGINSLFQAAKRKARGYRTEKNIIAMVYVLAGKLNFALK